jgi:hypothetical protein
MKAAEAGSKLSPNYTALQSRIPYIDTEVEISNPK